MKAALFDKPGSLNVVSKDLRKLQEGEVLVKVEVCGVCGTDLHIVEGSSRSTPPVILGHEYTGMIAGAGSGVYEFKEGDRVAIDPNISCGQCYFCRRGEVHLCANLRALGVDIDGGMAEYSIVPANQLYRVPDSLPDVAAAFIEPVSCVVHGVDKARIRPGDTVAIIGAGTIGLLMLQMVRSAGAARTIIVEPLPRKQSIARDIGADTVLSPQEAVAAVRDLTHVGADTVIECAGKPETARQALTLSRRGGTVEFFGVCPMDEKIEIAPNEVYSKELTIVGSYVNPHTFSRAITLLASGTIGTEKFSVSKFPLSGVHDALSSLREGKVIKNIILPNL